MPMGIFSNIGTSIKNGLTKFVEPYDVSQKPFQGLKDKVVDTVSPLSSVSVKDGFQSLADAINNGFGAYSSSAVAFEKEALKNMQDFNANQALLAFQRSQSSAREQMDFQRSEREAAQAYNTLMSNTQYQRAVADLKAAGINPIMAVKGLSGSAPTISAMSGASASSPAASSSKADFTGAINQDEKAIDAILGLLSSSMNLFKLFKKPMQNTYNIISK